MADRPAYPGTPRWVKAAAVVVGLLVVLVAAMLLAGLGGPHGPGRHLPQGSTGAPLSALAGIASSQGSGR